MSLTDSQLIAAAHRERLNQGLRNLAEWCAARAAGDHDTDTTLTMLEKKAAELRRKVLKAGWAAIVENANSPSVGEPQYPTIDPGEGWRLLDPGEPLQDGDGFLDPQYPDIWIDFACRPDLFRGGGSEGSWYHVVKNDTAHTYPWRRKTSAWKGDPANA